MRNEIIVKYYTMESTKKVFFNISSFIYNSMSLFDRCNIYNVIINVVVKKKVFFNYIENVIQLYKIVLCLLGRIISENKHSVKKSKKSI